MNLRVIVLVVAAVVVPRVGAGQIREGAPTVTFDNDTAGQPPAAFSFGRTGGGAAGGWVVLAEKDAPSAPNVLAQVDTDATDDRFPVAVVNAPAMKDGKVSVRCKPVSGSVDQACGVVVRYQDPDNYYLARANALEDNIRLYYVKDGRRRQLASVGGKVARGTWHQLALEATGDRLQVSFDGKTVLDATDRTFPGPGKAGVWTKADSVTYFDDLTVTPR